LTLLTKDSSKDARPSASVLWSLDGLWLLLAVGQECLVDQLVQKSDDLVGVVINGTSVIIGSNYLFWISCIKDLLFFFFDNEKCRG
jgi:hypothetical protein